MLNGHPFRIRLILERTSAAGARESYRFAVDFVDFAHPARSSVVAIAGWEIPPTLYQELVMLEAPRSEELPDRGPGAYHALVPLIRQFGCDVERAKELSDGVPFRGRLAQLVQKEIAELSAVMPHEAIIKGWGGLDRDHIQVVLSPEQERKLASLDDLVITQSPPRSEEELRDDIVRAALDMTQGDLCKAHKDGPGWDECSHEYDDQRGCAIQRMRTATRELEMAVHV